MKENIVRKTEERAEKFLHELRHKTYLQYSGISKEYDLSGIYRKHEELFSTETIAGILDIYHRDKDKQTKYLLKFLLEGHIGEAVKEIDAQIAQAEVKGFIVLDGKEIPYRQVLSMLFNTEDADKRHEIDRLRREFIHRFNEKRHARIDIVNDKASLFGYSNYAALNEEFKEVCMETQFAECTQFLDATANSYREELAYYMSRAGIDPGTAQRSDMFMLARASDYDVFFPSENLLPCLRNTLSDLGIQLADQKNIQVDVEDRPGKAARPFCVAVDTPSDVRLVFKVRGGREDYVNLFHEMGHAQHFGNIDAGLPIEFKTLGDYAVTEGFAYLFQYLISNPCWLEKHLEIRAGMLKEYIRLAEFLKRYLMRRYACKFIYEYPLFANGASANSSYDYAEIFSEHLGVAYFPEDYMVDIDVSFYCLNYIWAWTVEGAITTLLEEKFQKDWMTRREAGEYLASLWKIGHKYNTNELCARLNTESGFPC